MLDVAAHHRPYQTKHSHAGSQFVLPGFNTGHSRVEPTIELEPQAPLDHALLLQHHRQAIKRGPGRHVQKQRLGQRYRLLQGFQALPEPQPRSGCRQHQDTAKCNE